MEMELGIQDVGELYFHTFLQQVIQNIMPLKLFDYRCN